MQEKIVTIELPNGAEVLAEVTELEPVGAMKTARVPRFDFAEVGKTLEGLAQAISSSVAETKPRKVGVELGLKLTAKSGALTALLVEGQGEASLKVTLEWEGAATGA